jgi:hypothetical protein
VTRWRGERLVVGLVGVLVLSACGVPTGDSPTRVADDDLPASLRSAVTSTTSPPTGGQELVRIYLIRDNQLVRVNDRARTPGLGVALALLQRGPTKEQARAGHRSAFTDLDLIRDVRLADSTAIIDLDPSFSDLPDHDQILALGQIVLTAVSYPGVSRVRFTVENEPIDVPTGDGTLTSSLLTRSEYEGLLLP